MKFLARLPRWVPSQVMFLILYFGMDGILHFAGWWFHVWPRENDQALKQMHRGVLVVTSALLGLTRAAANHPARKVAYKNWLRSTPWHPGMPLPLGPAMLHWRDGLTLLGLSMLASWNGGISPLFLLFLFGCFYCLASLLPLLQTRQFTEAYAIALVGSALLWLGPWPLACVALVASLVLLAQEGLWRSLSRFPWEFPESTESKDPWPLRIYADCDPRIPTRRGLLTALLIALWVSGLVHVLQPDLGELTLWLMAGSFLGGFIRYATYYTNLRPPVTLLGRLRAGRIILPNYDHARLAPALAAILGSLAPALIVWADVRPPLAAGVTVFLVIVVLLIAGPELRTWQLTGFHHLVSRAGGGRATQQRSAA